MARHIHVHIHRRAVRDAEPTPMEDLVSRLLAAIKARKTHATQDEEEGHEFHGNQYTNGAGGTKPTKATAKGSKAGVHELLSSGHHFTLEELMEATGTTNKSTILTAISDLKNPKYAGKLGALQIGKHESGHFHVVKADGKTPAVTPPAEKEEAPTKKEEAPAAAEVGSLKRVKGAAGHGSETHVSLPGGKVGKMSRLNSAESMGLPGWHGSVGNGPSRYLGETEKEAAAELVRLHAAKPKTPPAAPTKPQSAAQRLQGLQETNVANDFDSGTHKGIPASTIFKQEHAPFPAGFTDVTPSDKLVPFDKLVPSQPSVGKAQVGKYVKGGAGGDAPEVVKLPDGRYQLVDGHHRAAAHILEGNTHVPVRVVGEHTPEAAKPKSDEPVELKAASAEPFGKEHKIPPPAAKSAPAAKHKDLGSGFTSTPSAPSEFGDTPHRVHINGQVQEVKPTRLDVHHNGQQIGRVSSGLAETGKKNASGTYYVQSKQRVRYSASYTANGQYKSQHGYHTAAEATKALQSMHENHLKYAPKK
jgi:hypothetical protein